MYLLTSRLYIPLFICDSGNITLPYNHESFGLRTRALDRREYLMIIFVISRQNYVLTPHLNHLNEMVQMRGHNICS